MLQPEDVVRILLVAIGFCTCIGVTLFVLMLRGYSGDCRNRWEEE